MAETFTTGGRPHVVFYSKPGCHLCEEAKGEIARAGCEHEYTFEEVNIETDAGLLRRFGWEIPVVTINGTVSFKYTLTAEDFRLAVKKVAGF